MNGRQVLLNAFYTISIMFTILYEAAIVVGQKYNLFIPYSNSSTSLLALLSRMKKLQFEEGK